MTTNRQGQLKQTKNPACCSPEDAQPGWHKPRVVQMPANPDIVLDKVQCSGAEGSLVDCRHLPWNINDCSPTELAAVTCTAVTRSLQGEDVYRDGYLLFEMRDRCFLFEILDRMLKTKTKT